MRLRYLLRIVLIAAACSSWAAPGMARSVSYEVKRQALDSVIDTLSDLSGVAVVKAGAIPGTMENWSVRAEGVAVFEALARDANLFMAFDGAKVIIAARTDVRTTVLSSATYDWPTVQGVARSLYPIMPPDALRYDGKARVILVRGPSSFTEAISAIATRPTSGIVRVIKGGSIEDVNLQPVR